MEAESHVGRAQLVVRQCGYVSDLRMQSCNYNGEWMVHTHAYAFKGILTILLTTKVDILNADDTSMLAVQITPSQAASNSY